MKRDIFYWMRRVVYLIILIGLIIFLMRQGVEPWLIVGSNWPALLAVVVITAIGILVQANAFLTCLPFNTQYPKLKRVIHIWATSGMMSLIAPLIASLAVRSILLQRQGVSLKASALATIRQAWFNCEYALAIAAITLILDPWPNAVWLGYGVALIWFSARLVRTWVPHQGWRWVGKYFPSLPRLSQSPPWAAFAWLLGQVIVMAVNYFVVFTLLGVALSLKESLLLAAITILSSVIVLIPNGLGILDMLWFWIATRHGLVLEASTALVLTMRFGYLIAALILSVGLSPEILSIFFKK